MKNTKPEETIYAFIDSQNLNLSIKSLKWELDFKRFRIYLKEKYHVEKAFLFLGFIPTNQKLYTILQKYGYIIIFKPTLVRKDGEVKGNVDAELVLHTMIEYDHYDKAIIVSGDGDFYCLVEYLNNNNKLLKLLIPNAYRYSGLLKPFAANKVQFMNVLKKKLAKKNERQLHKD